MKRCPHRDAAKLYLASLDLPIPRRLPFPQGPAGSPAAGPNAADVRNAITDEMNLMLAENIDSILGSSGSSTKLEKALGRLTLVSDSDSF